MATNHDGPLKTLQPPSPSMSPRPHVVMPSAVQHPVRTISAVSAIGTCPNPTALRGTATRFQNQYAGRTRATRLL